MKKLILVLVAVAALASCGKQSESKPAPEVRRDSTVIEFDTTFKGLGMVEQAKPVDFTFTFRNAGKKDLVISEVETGCHCTAAEYPKTPVKPGESGEIKVAFDGSKLSKGRSGYFNRIMTVHSNAQGSPHKLRFSGRLQ